jgi:hypothetical protein
MMLPHRLNSNYDRWVGNDLVSAGPIVMNAIEQCNRRLTEGFRRWRPLRSGQH